MAECLHRMQSMKMSQHLVLASLKAHGHSASVYQASISAAFLGHRLLWVWLPITETLFHDYLGRPEILIAGITGNTVEATGTSA